MRFFVIISILSLFCSGLKGQVFTVGNTCCNYNLVNKTFIIPSTTCTSGSDSYAFDINGDAAMDINVGSFYSPPCFAGGVTSKGITITTTTNCEFVYSTAPTCPYRYIENLPFGTPLNAAMNWSIYPSTWNIGQASPYIYFEYSKPSVISYTCNTSSNPFYVGFRKIQGAGDTIYGWIKMDTNFPGKVFDYAYYCTYTGTPQPSTITTGPQSVCQGDSILLSALPSGGSFSGTGVSGNYFKSKGLTPGVYSVIYTIPSGCSSVSSSVTFTVNPSSYVYISVSSPTMCSGQTMTLTGSPAGGTFSGTGVTGNVFNSTVTGPGSFPVYYAYTNSSGCTKTVNIDFTVTPYPNITITASPTVVCLGDAVTLHAFGGSYCNWNTGAYGNVIQETPTVVSTVYSVIGSASGCADTASITVNASTQHLIITAVSNHSVICMGDTAILTLTGSKDWYTLWTSTFTGPIASSPTNTMAITPTVTTTYFIRGDSTVNGCQVGGFFTQTVSSCVGVNEIAKQEIHFQIFPNPTSGEFEIKGTKEATIFITNELGQLIDTKSLNSQNNYSIKINELQSGIYFVGNQISRQKIVVIR